MQTKGKHNKVQQSSIIIIMELRGYKRFYRDNC